MRYNFRRPHGKITFVLQKMSLVICLGLRAGIKDRMRELDC